MAKRISTHLLKYLEGYLLRERERAKVSFLACPIHLATQYQLIHPSIFQCVRGELVDLHTPGKQDK